MVSNDDAGTSTSDNGSINDNATSFVSELDPQERSVLEQELRTFALKHVSHHRPIALVTSGGTAADLELNSVRCLDNFSTGLRGAISVEEFLRRGYAVIHLCRGGSASPFARVLCQSVGSWQANHGPSVASMGKLFAGDLMEEGEEDQLVRTVLLNEEQQIRTQNYDPWMTEPTSSVGQPTQQRTRPTVGGVDGRTKLRSTKSNSEVILHRHVVNSSRLQTALQERSAALREGRLFTVTFRSVEEYLAKLQLCAESLRHHQSLAILYLAAAVSDFYIPKAQRSPHKIQSKEYEEPKGRGNSSTDGSCGLTLKLHPVPKVMGMLRRTWAPNAFLCSFKLETDRGILRDKAERAVRKYGCDMVIGNLLQTRHSQVWILAPTTQLPQEETVRHNETSETNVKEWPFHEITKPLSSEPDALESMLIDHVVQTHFEYVSFRCDKSGTDAMVQARDALARKKQQVEREIFWKSVQRSALEFAGVALGAVLSYVISSALKRRMSN